MTALHYLRFMKYIKFYQIKIFTSFDKRVVKMKYVKQHFYVKNIYFSIHIFFYI